MSKKIETFEAYSVGICYASVCTNIKSKEEIVDNMNAEFPTGILSRWKISKDPTFASGQPNPCKCEEYRGHNHYLLSC